MELRDNMGSLGFPSPPTGPLSPPPSPPDNENTSLAVPPTATLNGFFLDAYPEAARALWTCRKGAARLLDMSVQFLGFPASVAGKYEPIFAYYRTPVRDSNLRCRARALRGRQAVSHLRRRHPRPKSTRTPAQQVTGPKLGQ